MHYPDREEGHFQMSSGRLNRNRNRPVFGDLRDETTEDISYVRLLNLEISGDNAVRKERAERLLKIMSLVLAGVKNWAAPGFDQLNVSVTDLHTNNYFARMTHETIDRMIREDSTTDLSAFPEDVELEIILFRMADRELKKAGRELNDEEFVKIIGKG